MEYNYYPQSGHPPYVGNQPHGGTQMQQAPGGHMMHGPMPQENIRQAMPPGPPNHHPQMHQPQQHLIAHHPQQMPLQQQQHPNYHQIHPPLPPGSQMPHSASPHGQPQQQQQPPPQQHLNHQPNMAGPPQQQQPLGPQPPPTHHMHPQSPHHHGGPPMHLQQQPQQQLNQMVRPPMGPSVMIHPQSGLQQHQPPPPPPHHQNFFAAGPIPQQNLHHYPPQQNQHHTGPHHPQPQHHQPMMQHAPITHPLSHLNQGIGRSSPYHPTILQTEFRIIELNRRLQCRPPPTHPISPLPTGAYDESIWWEKFASEFFEDDATLTLRLLDEKPSEFTIGRTLIPRFFRTYFDGGATDLSFNLRTPKEMIVGPQMITLDCDSAFITSNSVYRHQASNAPLNVVVHTEGHLMVDFAINNFDTLTIKAWRFYTRSCREYIDRSMTGMGLPNNILTDPVTRHGLTKSTIFYLKMCLIMEPMQELIFQNRQTKMDPRSCLRKFLYDRYKYRSGEDPRGATNKRRKRKPSAAPTITGAPVPPVTNAKKPKSNVNTSMANNTGMNNSMMSPSGTPSFSLASQDVMVVGEPTMMGGDFGDDNERMITRLENTQYDPTASTPSHAEESDLMNSSLQNDNSLSNSNNIESTIESNTMSPLLHPRTIDQQHQHQYQHQHLNQLPQHHPHQQQSQQLPPQPPNQTPPQMQIQPSTGPQLNPQVPMDTSPSHDIDLQQPSSGPPSIPQPQPTTMSQPQSQSPPTIQQAQGQPQHTPQQEQETQLHLKLQPQPELQTQQLQQQLPSNSIHVGLEESSKDSIPGVTNHIVAENNGSDIKQNGEVSVQVPVEGHNAADQATPHLQNNNHGQCIDETEMSDDDKKQLLDQKQELSIKQQQTQQVDVKREHIEEDANPVLLETTSENSHVVGVNNSVDKLEDHSNSIQLNDESNSNSQLPCPSATTTPIEQQQPVDNGIA